MDMKSGANGRNSPEDCIETADDATIISWSVFESLEELRRLSAVETSQPPTPTAKGKANAAGQGSDDDLPGMLAKYNAWLRTVKNW